LSVSGSLLATELPEIRKALDAGDHSDGKARSAIDREIRRRRLISDTEAIHTEFTPLFSGASRSQVRATVLL